LIKEVRMPRFPECWDTCGSCGNGEVMVETVHVTAGDRIRADEPLITLETGKVALDIPSPYEGTVLEVLVAEGEPIAEAQLIVRVVTT
jgi:pyruvate/2-oxoglutarate dehydrogenase complex dihydrolipoamide acyltransferase (E2) component